MNVATEVAKMQLSGKPAKEIFEVLEEKIMEGNVRGQLPEKFKSAFSAF